MTVIKPILAFLLAALVGAAAVACSSSSADSGNACVEV